MTIRNDEDLLENLLDKRGNYGATEEGSSVSPVIVTDVVYADAPAPTAYKPSRTRGRRRRRGCPCWCKCICITFLVFFLISIATMLIVFSCLKDVAKELSIETDTPKKFPIVEMSDSDLDAVEYRVESYLERVRDAEEGHGGGAVIEDLVLEQDEINGFIGHSDYLRGNLMITLHKDRILEEYSLPMDILGLDGRYFVGSSDLTLQSSTDNELNTKKNTIEITTETEAAHEDWFHGPLFFVKLQYLMTKSKEDEGQNILELFLEQGSFFGHEIPKDVIEENKHTNLLTDLYDMDDDDDDVEDLLEVISGIERVSIEEGRIVVKARSRSS